MIGAFIGFALRRGWPGGCGAESPLPRPRQSALRPSCLPRTPCRPPYRCPCHRSQWPSTHRRRLRVAGADLRHSGPRFGFVCARCSIGNQRISLRIHPHRTGPGATPAILKGRQSLSDTAARCRPRVVRPDAPDLWLLFRWARPLFALRVCFPRRQFDEGGPLSVGQSAQVVRR